MRWRTERKPQAYSKECAFALVLCGMDVRFTLGHAARRGFEFAAPAAATNCLLAALPSHTYRRLTDDFEPIRIAVGAVIFEDGERASHAYFPEDCVVSLLGTTRDGVAVETGIVGSEGAIGIAAFLGGGQMHGRAVVQKTGRLRRLPAPVVIEAFRRCNHFQSGLLRFTQAFMTQVSQRAICQRICTIDQRLGCWLLLMHDRVDRDELETTQETVAGLLGARREGVNIAVKRLRDRGIVRSTRGSITILDRAALEACSCECYDVIRKAYDRLIER